MKLIYISEALRMFRRSLHVRKYGIKKYRGSPEQIAEQIISNCWNKKGSFFQTSAGHFNEFYCRDFGMCVEALTDLGYKKQVHKTLEYALNKFQQHGRITTTISPEGVCFDFPSYGADSLPFIIHALKVSGADHLIKKYCSFLQQEIKFYYQNMFDKNTNLVRRDRHFSSMKDYAKRSSDCYSNCMLFMLADELKLLNIKSPFPVDKIRKAILKNFWNGSFFHDDLEKTETVTGDANTFPFWCGVTGSKDIFKRCLSEMRKAKLDEPFPLKYTTKSNMIHKMYFLEFFAGNYERDSVWMHLGLCFLDIVKSFDKKQFELYMRQYADLIRRHRNFLEVYDRKDNPFHNLFYYSDESMLWVCKWLWLNYKK
jgi:hypothetical protein